jgi:glycosyltransferase involved in cell wall biosynthesis
VCADGRSWGRRIRILRIITRLNTGGPAVYLSTLCRGLSPSRYEQWLVTGIEGPGEQSMLPTLESQGIRPITLSGMVGTPSVGFRDLAAVARVRQLIRDLRPDIIETHLSKAGLVGRVAAALEGSALVLHVYHGHVLAGYFGAAKTWVARRAERALARVSDHLLAVSPRVKSDLVSYGVAPADRISVIEPGVDLDTLQSCRESRGALRRELGVAPDVPLVGIVGRLCPIKNHDLFLEVAARIAAVLPGVRFLVVGDGELGSAIRARAHRLGLSNRVIFAGWRSDLAQVYSDLDVLVSCSHNEGMPISLIEAMAAGCPVLATNVGGVPDLIDDHQTGLLVPDRDPSRLTATLLGLLQDGELARGLAASAQSHVRARFGTSRFVADMDELYTRLLSEPACATSSDSAFRSRPLAMRTNVPVATDAERHAPV